MLRRLTSVLITLLVAGCGTAVLTPGPSTLTSTPSPAPTTSSPSAPASPRATLPPSQVPSRPSAVRGRDWEWRNVWFEDPQGQMPALSGVLFTGEGFTAWGPNAAGGSAIETSASNLSSWGQSGNATQFGGIRLIGLAWAPAGIVALGSDKTGRVHAWVSADGLTWKPGPAKTGIDGTVHAIVSSAGGLYYAAGTAKGGCDVAVWFSYDGLAWKPSQTLSGARGACPTGGASAGSTITLVRDGGAGLVAYGTVPGIGSAFWTSADKVHWTFHPQPTLGGHVAGLAATRSGYIAVGTADNGGATAWMSPDGVNWTRAPDEANFAGAAMSDVLALDDGSLVAVGSDANHAFVAWTSSDGMVWARAPEPLSSTSGLPGPGNRAVQWRLASDGHASTNPSELLVAVEGGSRAMVSPPITLGLRTGSLTIGLSGSVDLPTETVAATCADSEDGTGGTHIHAILADLAKPNPADVSLAVASDGRVTGFGLDMDNLLASWGNGLPLDPSTLTITPGSTPKGGGATFRNLPNELAPTASPLLAGSVTWECSW